MAVYSWTIEAPFAAARGFNAPYHTGSDQFVCDRLWNAVRAVGRKHVHRACGKDDDHVHQGLERDVLSGFDRRGHDGEGPVGLYRAVLEHIKRARQMFELAAKLKQ